jgi:hypothetical protein
MVPQTSGYHEGMTLRDYFAAKAMQSHIVTNFESLCKRVGTDAKEVNQTIAAWSYRMADAMLNARAK